MHVGKRPIRNPHAHEYKAGSSSSGCRRLVTLELVDMAVGCDQTGSIRVPAAHCGIVGLKLTWGPVPCRTSTDPRRNGRG